MKLSNEALFLLAAEETVFGDSQDALDRLAYLVGPVFLGIQKGRILTSEIVCETVEQNFGIPLPPDVAGALLFRLGQKDFVDSVLVDEARVFSSKGVLTKENGDSAIDKLIKDFRLFVADKKLLPEISNEEILDLFMGKVFEISDFLNDEDFTLREFKPNEKWKISLISDYILQHSDADGGMPPLLTKLAELCLMRSVVGNLMNNRKRPKKTTLKVIVDAPVALFAIGASGRQQQQNILATFDLAKSFGVQFLLLPTSVSEMSRVIRAVLSNDHRNRRGYTAAAIRRGDIVEKVAHDMSKGPEKYVKSQGVTVSPRNLSSYPNEKQYFDDAEVNEFSATASSWAKTYAAQQHDAECFAITMRARSGKHERNLFSNEYVFITYNGRFASAARRYCLEKFKINSNQFPPVVHVNSFAAAVWLTGGFDSRTLIPEKTLLAACERALTGVDGVLSRTELLAKELSLTDETTLELLLEDRDSVNAIVESSGYDPSLINEENVSKLIEVAKAAIARDVSANAASEKEQMEADFKKREEDQRRESREAMKVLNEKFELFKDEIDEKMDLKDKALKELEAKQQRDEFLSFQDISIRVDNLNKRIDRRGWGMFETSETVFFILASILATFKSSLIIGLLAFSLGGFFVILSYLEIGWPSQIKKWLFRKFAAKSLQKEFSRTEIDIWGIDQNSEGEVQFEKVAPLTPPPSPATS